MARIENDEIGGRAIRDASVRTMRRRRDTSESNDENEDPNPRAKKHSRRDVQGDLNMKMGRIEGLLEDSLKQNATFQKEITEGIQEANRAYVTTQHEFLSLLSDKL
ncbi:hypothetical protein HWV62_42422 [Athelia sp. TMB]|nr:hypothetical protein HWV62_42422 [Athelia sp. TMB]